MVRCLSGWRCRKSTYYIGTHGGNITRGGTNQIPQVRADSGVNTVQTAGVSGTGANLCQSPKNKQEEGYMRKPTSKKLTCLALSLLMALGTAQTAVMAAGEDTAATTNTNTKTTLQEISESLSSISYAAYKSSTRMRSEERSPLRSTRRIMLLNPPPLPFRSNRTTTARADKAL